MALIESGLKDHGWKRCMQSLREQLRPEDDTGFHYLNGRLEQLQAALVTAEERRKSDHVGPVPSDIGDRVPEHREAAELEPADPVRVYAQEVSALRGEIATLRAEAITRAPRKPDKQPPDSSERLFGRLGKRRYNRRKP